jgi:16S rRNA (guanine527-N7)-methyltransferase
METLSNSLIEATLRPYGAAIESAAADKIRAYISLLLKWNRTMSLTTVTDPVEILKFHFGESIFAASVVNFAESRLADVGSGAGFPGLPLALLIPSVAVTLIESNTKKCAFLSEVVRELQLPNVTVFRGRMEIIPQDHGLLDFITARAFGKFDELLSWSSEHIAETGKIALWLGEADSHGISKNGDWNWERSILIPGSERRYLLVGSQKSGVVTSLR